MRSMPVQPSGWIKNHVLLYKKKTLVFAQPEMGKRAKSIYYEVYGKSAFSPLVELLFIAARIFQLLI